MNIDSVNAFNERMCSLQFAVQCTQTLDIVKSNSNSDSPTSIQLNALPFAHKVVPIGLTYLVVGTLFWKYHQPILGQVRWRTLPKNANSNQPDDKKTENKHISVNVSIPCPTSRKPKTRTKKTIQIKMEKCIHVKTPCQSPLSNLLGTRSRETKEQSRPLSPTV